MAAVSVVDRWSMRTGWHEGKEEPGLLNSVCQKIFEKVSDFVFRGTPPARRFSCSNPEFESILAHKNSERPLNAPVVLVAQAVADKNGAFKDCESILELADTHYVVFKTIDSPEALFSVIHEVTESLKAQGRSPIGTLIIRGHGTPFSIRLGFGSHPCLKMENFVPGCLDELSPTSSILCSSCELARQSFWRPNNIASAITRAAGASRVVRAFKESVGNVQFKICPEHGIVMQAGSHQKEELFSPETVHFCNQQLCTLLHRISFLAV